MCARYEQEILHSPSESPFVEYSTHPKKVCDHLLFGVPLDLWLGLLSLQYETDTFAYLICFMIELIKICLCTTKNLLNSERDLITTQGIDDPDFPRLT
jgi:hypothetical protein